MKWWQDVENYEESYLKGKLYIVNEVKYKDGSYHVEMRSNHYRCNYYLSKSGRYEIRILPSPSLEFSLERDKRAYPIAHKSFGEDDFTIENYAYIPVTTSTLQGYNESLAILEWTIAQVTEFSSSQ